jgi:hypothetical protein
MDRLAGSTNVVKGIGLAVAVGTGRLSEGDGTGEVVVTALTSDAEHPASASAVTVRTAPTSARGPAEVSFIFAMLWEGLADPATAE